MKALVKIFLLLVVITAVVGAVRTGYHKLMDRFFPLKYEETIEKYSEDAGLNKYLVMAVINAESGFDEKAHSGVAKGLMQITDSTAKWVAEKMEIPYSEDMTYDPEVNIKMGCWYLSYLEKKYGSIDTALAAYNAGLGNVDSWLSDTRYSSDGKTLDSIPFKETENYVVRVRRMTGIYQKAY